MPDKRCGTCSHWKRLGMPPRTVAVVLPWPNVRVTREVRDCAAIGGRGGQQRADAEPCEAYKEKAQ